MNIYRIKIRYEPQPIPEASEFEEAMPKIMEEEIIEVGAESIEKAARKAMAFATIGACGRTVRYYGEDGEEVFTH